MTLVEYITALKRHWLVIVSLSILGAGSAFAYSQTLPLEFSSTASVVVVPVKGETTGELVQGSNYVQNLVQTYTIVAASPIVLNRVIAELGLDEEPFELARRVSVEAPLNTAIITIAATDGRPEGARDVANAVGAGLSEAVAQLSPQGDDGKPAVRIEIISPARLTTVPVAPNSRIYALLGLLAGLAVGVAFALVRRLLGTRLTSITELRQVTDAPLLGEIASAGDRVPLPTMIRNQPTGRVAESLRSVVAALRFVDVENSHRVLLMTSPQAAEGKTSLSLGLAMVLAEMGHRVLYVEADLRRPKAGEYTHLEGAVGLTTVLVGDLSLEESVQEWGHDSLHVLASGALPPNPAQLLSSDRVREVLSYARSLYDYVIVDSAPVLPVADAMWLAPVVDGIILVTRLNKTTRQDLLRSLKSIESSLTPLLGIIANEVKKEASPYYDSRDKKVKRGRRSGAKAV